ncbi:MAG: mechanosensitive ion channel family protein [Desulfobacteraceae bacterium]|nr:mechanosensitive ion channel family protein [Desulfobacteraceae bacterium]
MDNIFNYIDNIFVNIVGESGQLLVFYKFLAAIGISLFVWLILGWFLRIFEKRMGSNSFFQDKSNIFKLIKRVITYSLILVTGTYLIRLFNIRLFENIFYAIIIVLLANPFVDFIKIFLKFLEKNIAERTKTNVDNIIFELLNKFVGIVIYLTAIIISLDIIGVNVMPFIAGAGVAGIAIGFAAKDTLSNLIAGILLIIDRPFEIGDRIEVWSAPQGSSTWGDVVQIGLRATKINTTDNIIIIIPNNEIMTRDIVNYTINSSDIRVRVNIGVAYDTDIPKAKKAIINVASTVEWVKDNPEPKVVVRNFGESSVDLQLRVWISNARKRMDTISHITDKVKEEFDKEGIEIPYPKRDITVINKTQSPES